MPKINEVSGQVSDSSAGLTPEDFSAIEEKLQDARSGAEISAMEDRVYEFPNAAEGEGGELVPSRVLSDEEAGYDQDEYDEEADAFDSDPESESFIQSAVKALIPDAGASDHVPTRAPASVDNSTPRGKKQIDALRAEGVPENDIREWRNQRAQAFREEDIPEEEIAAYFGDPAYDETPTEAYIRNSPDWHAPMVLPHIGGRAAKTLFDSFQAGLEGSSLGLAIRGELPSVEPKEDGGTLDFLAHSAGMIAGDLIPGAIGAVSLAVPTTAAVSSVATPVVGVPAGIGAGWFGAGAVPAGMRRLLTDYYKKGQVTSAQDFWDRTSAVLAQATKEGAISLATGGAAKFGGSIAGKAVSHLESGLVKSAVTQTGKISAEVATMGTAGAAVEGRLPEKDDFIHSAVAVIGLNAAAGAGSKAARAIGAKRLSVAQDRVAARLENRLMNTYAETGLRPEQVHALAESDPVLTRELLQDGEDVPKSLEKYKDTHGRPDFDQKRTVDIPERLPETLGGNIESTQLEFAYRPETMSSEPSATLPEGTIAPVGKASERFAAVTPEQIKAMSHDEANKLVRGRIKPGQANEKGLSIPSMAELQRQILDEYDPILRIQKIITGAKTNQEAIDAIHASVNPYLLTRNLKGVVGKAITAVQHETFDYETSKRTGESLTKVLAKYKGDQTKAEGFENYLVAARSVELGMRDKESGVNEVAAKKLYEENRATYGKDAKRLVEYQNRILKYATDAGVISKKSYAGMINQGEHYVPFKRILEDGGARNIGSGLRVKNPVKGLEGSAREIVSPIESIVRQTHDYIAMAERNRVMRALRDMLEPQKDAMELVEVEKGKESIGSDGAPEVQYRKLHDNEVAVYEDGKRKIFKVGDDIAKAISGMDSAQFDLIHKSMAKVASALRAGATLVPEFIAKNLFRDQIHSGIMSKNGYIPGVDLLRGLFSHLTQDKNYVEWLKGGGMSATANSLGRDYIAENVFRLARETGFMKTAQNVVSTPLQMLKATAELGETATRLGEYIKARKNALKAGHSEIDAGLLAAYDARNITLDFQRRGAYIASLNAITPFLNAKNQGIDQIIQAVKDGRKDALFRATSLTLGSAALWYLNKDDPRYKELQPYQKGLFWSFFTHDWVPALEGEKGMPNSEQHADGTWWVNRGKIFRVPKPQEMGMLFGTSIEAILDNYYLKDPKAVDDFAYNLFTNMLPDVPLAPKLIAELSSNHSYFYDRAIVPYDVEKSIPPLQYTAYTSEAAKFLSRTMFQAGLPDALIPSPAKTDYAVQGTFGTMGKYGLDGVSYALGKLGLASKELPDRDWDDLPGVRAFTIRMPEQTRSVSEYYKAYQEQLEWTNSLNRLKKEGNTNALHVVQKRKEAVIAYYMKDEFKSAQRELKDLRSQIAAMSTARGDVMTKEEKLRLTDALMWGRVQIAKAVLQSKAKIGKQFDNGELRYAGDLAEETEN